MAKPPSVRLPTWATDVAANIVDPGAAKQDDGWLDDERPPASFFNWWKNAVGQYLDYQNRLDVLDLKNWAGEAIGVLGSAGSLGFVFTDPLFVDADGRQKVMMASLGAGPELFFYTSIDGIRWQEIGSGFATTGNQQPKCAAYDSSGDVLVALFDGNDSTTSSDGGSNWTLHAGAITGSVTEAVDAMWHSPSGNFIMCGAGAGASTVQTSSNGSSWTERVDDATLVERPRAFATDGTVVTLVGGGGPSSTGIVFTSSNSTTWVNRTSFAPSTIMQTVVYDTNNSVWITVGNDKKVYSTPDPDTTVWTEIADLSGEGISTSAHPAIKIHEDGTLVIFFRQEPNTLRPEASWISYSFDDGLTWSTIDGPTIATAQGSHPGQQSVNRFFGSWLSLAGENARSFMRSMRL